MSTPANTNSEFIVRSLDQRDTQFAHVCVLLGLCLHAVLAVVMPFLFPEAPVAETMFHVAALCMLFLWMGFHHRTRFTFEGGVFTLTALGIAGFACLLPTYGAVDPRGKFRLCFTTGYILISTFAVLLTPYRGRKVFLAAAMYWTFAVVACGGFTAEATRWLLNLLFALGVATMGQAGIVIRARRAAEAALASRMLLAPRSMLGAVTADLEAVFGARLMRCVCLSSDWRNYQATAALVPGPELAATLDRYYTAIDRLLSEVMPGGTYVFDWIADELFVVLYAGNEDQEAKLPDLALSFARRLLLFKTEFHRLHQLPRSVDVGIAWGAAMVGIMGPDGLRKASAFGPAADAARAAQTAAKGLRRERGELDRVVFDEAFYQALGVVPAGRLDQTGGFYCYELEPLPEQAAS